MSGAGDCERPSRPCSLLLETPPPEREPLRFDVQLVGAPPEVEQLVNNIKQVAENFLYHWKTFPIVLPPSHFSGPNARPSDILVAPPCDEIDAAALDAGVEPHPLSPKQLHSIRDKGEFEVPSRHFPGQTHVWRVAGWLQLGRQRVREQLHLVIARSVALVVVVARDRVARDEPLSVMAGGRELLHGLQRLLDLLIGIPSLEARDLDKKIREERSRYLVAELICKPEHQDDITALAAWVSRAMRRAASEKTDIRDSHTTPRVPCVYTTPQNTQVDLRLYKRDILRKAAPHLQAILERESRGWFLHFRERRAALLAGQKMPMKDIEEEVRTAAMREYVNRVCDAVLASEHLQALGEDIPTLLAAQLRASAIVNRAEDGVLRKLETSLSAAEARICASHPILSKADPWRKERLSLAAHRLKGELRWAAIEDAAAAMQAHKLNQHRYLLLRDLAFLRDREPLLMKELRAAKTPTREFTWATRIWLPQNWVVVRHFRGRSERIPTVLSPRATSIVTPRSHPSQPVFLVEKEKVFHSSTRWPGWRLVTLAYRTWCWGWNVMFVLGVLVPWCSVVSARALAGTQPFVPDHELSQVNGTLFPKRSSETQTMWSRLLKLWRHVSKERTRFETEPDTGLLGKGLSRLANRLWNYGIVGGLGSICLLLLFPVVAILCSCLSLAAAVTAPLWIPAVAIATHVFNAVVYDFDCPDPERLNSLGSICLLLLFPVVAILCSCLSLAAAVTAPLWIPAVAIATHVFNAVVYDFDCPDPERLNRYFPLFEVVIWRIGILGVLQPIVAVIVAVLFCPLCALILLVGGVTWWSLRGVWEEVSWRMIISRFGRVPAHDSSFCRRVSGPGLKSTTYCQITSAQALAAVVARAEQEVLSNWATDIETSIERPLRDYEHFVDACFGPFSVQIAKTGAYKQLEKECSELTASLREKVGMRRRALALGLSDTARARVRMTSQDLRRAVQASAMELARIWNSNAKNEEWWNSRGLEVGDWHALAANTLVEVFDAEILVALEENEARLQLESGEGARIWAAKCGRDTAPPDVIAERDDWLPLGHTGGVWSEWGGSPAPRVPPPSLEVSAFSPRAPPHPPLPHPAVVALVLHNRESDNPVPLDSELCTEILKILEDAPDSDDRRDGVERYRGGGSEDGSSMLSSDTQDDIRSHDTRDDANDADPQEICRVSGAGGACRWTLTGRGVRLRADLASPEDITLDTDHQGTSV